MLGVHLAHHQEFKQILEHYQVSDRAKKALDELALVLLLAPTSTGRNTTIQYLLKTGRYHFLISDTTRQPRVNNGVPEENGREYWFRSEEEVLNDLKKGEYLEAEIIHDQQVSGISLRELENARKEKKIAIKDIEIKGVRNIIRAKSDTVVIMLLPSSFEEWQRRIASRGRMNEMELRRRFETALRIFKEGLTQDYYQYVISDDVERTAMTIDAIAQGKSNHQQDSGRALIERLQFELEQKLRGG